jgi:hypothetical protein
VSALAPPRLEAALRPALALYLGGRDRRSKAHDLDRPDLFMLFASDAVAGRIDLFRYPGKRE